MFLLYNKLLKTFFEFLLYIILKDLLLSQEYYIIILLIREQLNLKIDLAASCYPGAVLSWQPYHR